MRNLERRLSQLEAQSGGGGRLFVCDIGNDTLADEATAQRAIESAASAAGLSSQDTVITTGICREPMKFGTASLYGS